MDSYEQVIDYTLWHTNSWSNTSVMQTQRNRMYLF